MGTMKRIMDGTDEGHLRYRRILSKVLTLVANAELIKLLHKSIPEFCDMLLHVRRRYVVLLDGLSRCSDPANF